MHNPIVLERLCDILGKLNVEKEKSHWNYWDTYKQKSKTKEFDKNLKFIFDIIMDPLNIYSREQI